MAYNTNTNSFFNNGQNDEWRKDGFINFDFMLPDGSSFRIDALGIKASKSAAMKKLHAFLEANPDKVEEIIKSKCRITYRSAQKVEKDIDLGL